MKRLSLILLITGAVLWVVGRVAGALVFSVPDFASVLWVFSALSLLGPALVIVGIILRLFAPRTEITPVATSQGLVIGGGSDFKFWRNANIVGALLWLMFVWWIFLAMVDPSFLSYLYVGIYLFALPLSIFCIIVSYVHKKANLQRSVTLLKIPFYYGVCILVVFLLTTILNSLLGLPESNIKNQLTRYKTNNCGDFSLELRTHDNRESNGLTAVWQRYFDLYKVDASVERPVAKSINLNGANRDSGGRNILVDSRDFSQDEFTEIAECIEKNRSSLNTLMDIGPNGKSINGLILGEVKYLQR